MGNIAGFVLKFNDDVVIKSVYDPSPVGYSLPASNAFTGFTITGGNTYNHSEFNVEGNYNNGWDFYTKPGKQGNTFFFPASGWRYNNIGAMSDVSTYGACHAAGQSSITSGMLLYFRSYYVQIGNDYRSGGFAVRSAEKKVLKCALEEVAKGVWIKGGLWYVDWKKLQHQV